MTVHTPWIVGPSALTKPLVEVLHSNVVATESCAHDPLASPPGHIDSIAFMPAVPAPGAFEALTDSDTIKGPLLWLLTELQAALPALASSGSVVVLLPQAPAMGEVAHSAASAVCGAAMSMARTWSIELGKADIRVNTLLYAEAMTDPAASTIAPAVAAQLETFWDPRSSAITGQEIFVTAGLDIGRLHP
ncbi:hypothetical protein R1CP_38150 (plasmid) [Rhodococcus opacus]|uniref:Oxidoreductase n=1 Tax=Rhodococcus opacus TaxID=37919 RepID=A0A1B1KHZ3_RHOOP|nr:hypothetical protein [Rhodococcus opacus]ANS32229.1 hypothetical protein R1CP_38150 [Rhodococcus opacus]